MLKPRSAVHPHEINTRNLLFPGSTWDTCFPLNCIDEGNSDGCSRTNCRTPIQMRRSWMCATSRSCPTCSAPIVKLFAPIERSLAPPRVYSAQLHGITGRPDVAGAGIRCRSADTLPDNPNRRER